MTSTNAFALKNSDLNAFLFADVGVELNGSALTILSVLARLGQDPWAEAARWAKLPKTAAIDCLAQCIGKMPLGPQALAEAFATASSLVQLLPVRTRDIRPGVSDTRRAPTVTRVGADGTSLPVSHLECDGQHDFASSFDRDCDDADNADRRYQVEPRSNHGGQAARHADGPSGTLVSPFRIRCERCERCERRR